MSNRLLVLSGSALVLFGAVVGMLVERSGLSLTAALHAQGNGENARTPNATWVNEGSELLAKISRLVSPSVVHIEAERPSNARGSIEETGSGVIVEHPEVPGYFVATNRHVVVGAPLDSIIVTTHDGSFYRPEKVWFDRESDLAVLKIDAQNLRPSSWGDSDAVDIGHMVLAMGSPFGLSQSITFGIVSAKGRRSLKLGDTTHGVINQDFLQTDAAINPGNSGGPLVNLKGEVVGINTAIASSSGGNEGIGFSIPSNLVRRVVGDLLTKGRVERAYLGVGLDNNFNWKTARRLGLNRVRGARVTAAYDGTPAKAAGLQTDDVVITFDGVEVIDESHLIHLVSLLPVGKTVKLVVHRRDKQTNRFDYVSLEMKLTRRDKSAGSDVQPGTGTRVREMGLKLHEVEHDVARHFGYDSGTQGLIVTAVDGDGPAAGQLQVYDVIEEIGGVPVADIDDVKRVLTEQLQPGKVDLKVRRTQRGRSETHVLSLSRRPTRGDESR
jgi:serine protease Do